MIRISLLIGISVVFIFTPLIHADDSTNRTYESRSYYPGWERWDGAMDPVSAYEALKTDAELLKEIAQIEKSYEFRQEQIAPLMGRLSKVAVEAKIAYIVSRFSPPMSGPVPTPRSPLPLGLPKSGKAFMKVGGKTAKTFVEKAMRDHYHRKMGLEIMRARIRSFENLTPRIRPFLELEWYIMQNK